MASRALGAVFALVAAAAFGVSAATPVWWIGHPEVDGNVLEAKQVEVGLIEALGCNTGGDGSCESLPRDPMLELASYAELAALGLAALLAFLVMLAAMSGAYNRKGLAATSLFF